MKTWMRIDEDAYDAYKKIHQNAELQKVGMGDFRRLCKSNLKDLTRERYYTENAIPILNTIEGCGLFGVFFLIGVVLMYFGYFTPYSEIGLLFTFYC